MASVKLAWGCLIIDVPASDAYVERNEVGYEFGYGRGLKPFEEGGQFLTVSRRTMPYFFSLR